MIENPSITHLEFSEPGFYQLQGKEEASLRERTEICRSNPWHSVDNQYINLLVGSSAAIPMAFVCLFVFNI